MEPGVYDGLMDAECVEICDALNELPGIETFESCCGHEERPFRIFFLAETVKSLRPILVELDANEKWPDWKVEVSWASGGDSIYFMLEGPAGCFADANALAFFIRRWARDIPALFGDKQ